METPKVYGLWDKTRWARMATGEVYHSVYLAVMQATLHTLQTDGYEWAQTAEIREIGIGGQPVEMSAQINSTPTTLEDIDNRLYEILQALYETLLYMQTGMSR